MQLKSSFFIGGFLAMGSAHGQTELLISVDEVTLGSWVISAELLDPTDDVLAVMSDCSFHLDGIGIADFSYNPAFDSLFFGPASVTVTQTMIDFQGLNAAGPLADPAGPDSSNPQFIASFHADNVTNFDLTGQNSGNYDSGTNFPTVFFYQDVFGTPGSVPFRIEINPIPAPSTAVFVGFAGLACKRRKRGNK